MQWLSVPVSEAEHFGKDGLELLPLDNPSEVSLNRVPQGWERAYDLDGEGLITDVDELAGTKGRKHHVDEDGGDGGGLIVPEGAPHETEVGTDEAG